MELAWVPSQKVTGENLVANFPPAKEPQSDPSRSRTPRMVGTPHCARPLAFSRRSGIIGGTRFLTRRYTMLSRLLLATFAALAVAVPFVPPASAQPDKKDPAAAVEFTRKE